MLIGAGLCFESALTGFLNLWSVMAGAGGDASSSSATSSSSTHPRVEVVQKLVDFLRAKAADDPEKAKTFATRVRELIRANFSIDERVGVASGVDHNHSHAIRFLLLHFLAGFCGRS